MSREAVLIDVRTLYAQLSRGDDIVILSVGQASEGIPGAISVDPAVFAGAGGGLKGARPLPEIQDLQAVAQTWGIHSDTPVILYDSDGNVTSARGWWTLKWAGLTNVRLLDGGLAAWEEAGLPFARLETPRGGGTVSLSAGHLPDIDADGAADHGLHHVLIDARPAKAFGNGHIPGGHSLPASGNLDANDRFLPDAALRERYGFIAGRRVAVSCGSGVSAAHDVAALAILDIDATLFVGSWSAWSADPARQVATDLAA